MNGIRPGNRLTWHRPAPEGGGRVPVFVWSEGPESGTWWVVEDTVGADLTSGDYRMARSSQLEPRPRPPRRR